MAGFFFGAAKSTSPSVPISDLGRVVSARAKYYPRGSVTPSSLMHVTRIPRVCVTRTPHRYAALFGVLYYCSWCSHRGPRCCWRKPNASKGTRCVDRLLREQIPHSAGQGHKVAGRKTAVSRPPPSIGGSEEARADGRGWHRRSRSAITPSVPIRMAGSKRSASRKRFY